MKFNILTLVWKEDDLVRFAVKLLEGILVVGVGVGGGGQRPRQGGQREVGRRRPHHAQFAEDLSLDHLDAGGGHVVGRLVLVAAAAAAGAAGHGQRLGGRHQQGGDRQQHQRLHCGGERRRAV